MEYSRIGFDPINKESVDIGKIIDTIININKQSIEAKGAEIRTENLPVIKAVRVPLQQLFHNLITNSLKFVKENSKPIISIKCDELENFWQFTVEDNGIGIDKKDHDKVFWSHEKTSLKGQVRRYRYRFGNLQNDSRAA